MLSSHRSQCDESGPPCQSCAALDIPCTYNRPSRRRGPPNRHAEALKKQKIKPDASPKNTSATIPPPVPHNPILNSYPPSANPAALTLSGESICPLPTLQQLVDDFFTFIHPLIPIPHEPTFRAAFARREDVTNKRFLALLAAMVGNLVASFPRRPKLHLRSEAEKNMYPHSMALVKRCHDVAVEARGPGYLDNSNTVEDAAISYHLGLCAGYVYNIGSCRMYFGECMTILRVHNLYNPPISSSAMGSTSASPASGPRDPFITNIAETPANMIVQELGRRLFYICLVGFQTMHQLGSTDGRIYVPPETPTDRYPPLPMEVDDEYLLPTHVAPQPRGIISQLTGFNTNVRIFQCYTPLAALEIAFGTNEMTLGWERQRSLIWEGLQKTKTIVSDLPPELAIHNSQVQEPSPLTSWSFPQGDGGGGGGTDVVAQERRRIQCEIQKANIYISQLSTRSYLVDKYWSLYEAHNRRQKTTTTTATTSSSQIPSPETSRATVISESGRSENSDADFHAQTDYIGQMMREERGLVIKDLLCLLRNVKDIHIEPNGASFVSYCLSYT